MGKIEKLDPRKYKVNDKGFAEILTDMFNQQQEIIDYLSYGQKCEQAAYIKGLNQGRSEAIGDNCENCFSEEPSREVEEIVKEFNKKFPLVECSAHERTSSCKCICEELFDINSEAMDIRVWIEKTLTAYGQAERKKGFREGQEKCLKLIEDKRRRIRDILRKGWF